VLHILVQNRLVQVQFAQDLLVQEVLVQEVLVLVMQLKHIVQHIAINVMVVMYVLHITIKVNVQDHLM
jgi:hypothetical protein